MKTLAHQAISKKPLAISRKIRPVPHVADVVCGMKVVPSSAEWKTIYKGATYYFCASGCFKKFTNNPEQYVRT
jgi:YHS domain-containing protein